MPLIFNSNSLFVWCIDESEEQLLIDARLCDAQLLQLEKLTNPQHRLQWLAARNIAALYLQNAIYYKPNGAPMLSNSPLNISISHTANYVALYAASHQCGVDIELVGRCAARIERKFASADEVEIARNIFPKNPHLLIWCAKETLYKAAGIEGAEFRKDLKITGVNVDEIGGKTLSATAFNQNKTIKFLEIKDLLVTYDY